MRIEVEVREQTVMGDTIPTLDEIVLTVDGKAVCHLEQLSDQVWWIGIGDPDGQYVRCTVGAKRARVNGRWESDGAVPPRLLVDGEVHNAGPLARQQEA